METFTLILPLEATTVKNPSDSSGSGVTTERQQTDWSGLVCYYLFWSGFVRSGMVWYCLVWYGLIWSGLVCSVFFREQSKRQQEQQ